MDRNKEGSRGEDRRRTDENTKEGEEGRKERRGDERSG